MEKFLFNDLEISSVSIEELECIFTSMLSEAGSKLILSYNLDVLRNAGEYDSFKEISKTSDLILPDGFGVTSLLMKKYKKDVKRITGTETFELLLKIANDYQMKLALVGSTIKILNSVQNKILKQYPFIKKIKTISPPFLFERNSETNRQIINELKNFEPDILIIALGNPRQEIWLYNYKDEIEAKINIGLGAVFEFYSGNKKRAPVFFQKSGLEWLWRLFFEPGRLFGRYILNDIPFYLKENYKIRKARRKV